MIGSGQGGPGEGVGALPRASGTRDAGADGWYDRIGPAGEVAGPGLPPPPREAAPAVSALRTIRPEAGPAPHPTRPRLVAPDEVLVTLARTPAAAPTLAELAAGLGTDPRRLALSLTPLERAGLVQRWDNGPGGPAACLTPLAASRLVLALADGRHGEPRWVRAGAERPPRIDRSAAAERREAARAAALAAIADSRQSQPWEAVADVEAVGKQLARWVAECAAAGL